MRGTFLGVRGSVPAPGREFVQFGGQTACLALSHDVEDEPTLVLDAGTGLRGLSDEIAGPAFKGAVLLSHLHWDHLLGLPFFTKGDHPDADVDVLLPAQLGLSGHDLLARLMSPPQFPIGPEGLQGRWRFHAVEPGRHRVRGYDVDAFDVAHKGGRTFGYRVHDGATSLAYLPDHDASERPPTLAQRLRGVDVLVHDAQFLPGEEATARSFGHSTVEEALAVAAEAEAGHLVLFHHSPTRTDDQLAALEDSVRRRRTVTVAREGLVLQIGRR